MLQLKPWFVLEQPYYSQTHLDGYGLPGLTILTDMHLSQTGDADRMWIEIVKQLLPRQI